MSDDTTLGGYEAIHRRPPAFGGTDGLAYSVAPTADETPDAAGRYGAFLLFVRWDPGTGVARPTGHLETGYLAFAPSPEAALDVVRALPLADVKAHLDRCIAGTAVRP